MRKLSLHASALSDTEYDLFTKSLEEIVDDDNHDGADDVHYEKLIIGIREVRAWLRGRYSHVSVADIDGILKLFCPKLSPSDTISGGEFFAALRLVVHAENGKDVDRSLAFVQVDSARPPSPSKSLQGRWSNSASPVRRPTLESTFGSSGSSPHNPFVRPQHQIIAQQPPIHPSNRSESSKTVSSASQYAPYNPFFPAGPRSDDVSGPSKLPPLPPRKPSSLSTGYQNLAPAPPPPRGSAVSRARLERSLSPTKGLVSIPPVPPKPASHMTSNLIKQSLTASKVAQSMKKAEEQLEKERVMQVLKSSSVVSGTNIHNNQHPYNTVKQAKPVPRRRGALTSSEGSSDGGSGHSRQNAPPLPKRRSTQRDPPSQQPSPPLSASSLEQVALATAPDHHHQRERAEHGHEHIPPVPPPTHPDRKPHLGYHHLPSPIPASPDTTPGPSDSKRAKNLETFEAIYGPMTSSPKISPAPSTDASYFPSTSKSAINTSNTSASQPDPDSPSARVFRSKSLNQTAKPAAPPVPPPPRRKRPESVQVLGSPTGTEGPTGISLLSRHNSSVTLGHRRSSLSVSSTPSTMTQINSTGHGGGLSSASTASTSSSGIGGNIQRTIDALHSIHGQLQPKFEKARYKAEAGLSRRGYVRGVSHGERASPSRFEEREGLTLGGGASRNAGSRPAKDRWQEDYIGNGADGAQVDGFDFDEDGTRDAEERWVRGRGAVLPSMGESASTPAYSKSRHQPRHVFDDSPERDEFDTRKEGVGNTKSNTGWAPL